MKEADSLSSGTNPQAPSGEGRRTFHVCFSVELEAYITIEAESPEAAKAIAMKAEVDGLSMHTGDEHLDDLEVDLVGFREPPKLQIGAVIDLDELDRKAQDRRYAEDLNTSLAQPQAPEASAPAVREEEGRS
jgi:hypothetical protein